MGFVGLVEFDDHFTLKFSNKSLDFNDPKKFDDIQLVTKIWNHCKLKFVTVIAGCTFKLKTVPFGLQPIFSGF